MNPEPDRSRIDSPLSRARAGVDRYGFRLRIAERGNVVSVGDGIAWVEGLPSAAMEQILVFDDDTLGLTFQLSKDLVGAILLQETAALTAGTGVSLTGHELRMPVGDGLVGRVIDPLGNPLDGRGATNCARALPMQRKSPPIVERDFVHRPLYTGNKIIDTMIPIGRGQRQLIIGDNGVGKSTLALDAVVNQKDQGVPCVLVLIGQKRSIVVQTLEALKSAGATQNTTVVVAEATAPPGMKYLAPYAGCAVAEGWMADGRDALIVYDDLTTHAQAYRELSLLLRRPPGREAYPGDIFFLHARLLERSTCLAATSGGGSMTALPIVETMQGEISAYIPTNLISITDGQLYLDAGLFAGGMLPAVDIGKSVSRIGGRAQDPLMKREAGRMKLDYLQFLELEVFTRFGTHLEPTIARKIQRGRVLRELLKQQQRDAVRPEGHIAWLIAYNDGLLDDLPLTGIAAVQLALIGHSATSGLTLNDPRERWQEAVRAALQLHQESHDATSRSLDPHELV